MKPILTVLLLLSAALVLLFQGLLPESAHAQSQAQGQKLEIQVEPASVELSDHIREARALIVVRNPTTDTLRDIKLTWFHDVGLTVVITDKAELENLSPNSEHAWQISLVRTVTRPPTMTLHLRVDYKAPARDKIPESQRVALGALVVRRPEQGSVKPLADVQVKTTIDSLVQPRKGVFYLVITNTSDAPISVGDIRVEGPEKVESTVSAPQKNPIPVGEADVRVVNVQPKGQVQPGKHLFLFQTAVQREDGRQSQILVATHEVKLAVLGESEILNAFTLPSLLVLPGFLMMLTLSILWKAIPRWRIATLEDKPFPLQVTSPHFWFFTISGSFLMAGLYPLVTKGLGNPRDYLASYDMTDILLLWLLSVILAIILYMTIGSVRLSWQGITQWRWRRKMPQPGDGPIQTIAKLGRQKRNTRLPQVQVEVDGQSQTVFLLQPNDEKQEILVVGPSIRVDWVDGVDDSVREEISDLRGSDNQAALLADALDSYQQRGSLTVDWDRSGLITEPRGVSRANIKQYLPREQLVEMG